MPQVKLAAIDTNILIYLTAPSDDPPSDIPAETLLLQKKAQHLFTQFREQKIGIALPAVVAGEYLSHSAYSGENKLAQTLETLQAQFVILPFNTHAAEIYASLMHHRKEGGIITRYKDIMGVPRRCLHADIAILATAAAHNIADFYSGERKRFMRELAKATGLTVDIHYLDKVSFQERLL